MTKAAVPSRLKTIVLALVLLGTAVAVKWWYRTATLDDLAFVLRPVAEAITLFTGSPWTLVPAEGYVFRELGMVIDRSCSGINFLVIVWITFAFLLVRRSAAGCVAPYMAVIAGAGAYVLTLLANTGRILCLVALEQQGHHAGPKQHEALGAFFFISILLLASLALDRSLQPRTYDATIA
jgi:exosortase K